MGPMAKSSVLKAVIPAAGLGTRFLPATKSTPKEMIPLLDKPVIQYVVEEAVSSGIQDIIIITGRGKTTIEDHFDYSIELEQNLLESGKKTLLKQVRAIAELANISYVRQREARGLGHAILCARHLIGDEPFVVLLPDDIIIGSVPAVQQMIQVHNTHQGPVVGVQPVPKSETHLYGIITGDRIKPNLFRVTAMVEKPTVEKAPSTLAVVGRYLLTPEIFDILEKTRSGKNREIQLTDALCVLAQKHVLYARQLDGDRYDTGDKLGFLKATVALGLKQPDLGAGFRRYLKNLKL